MTPPLTAPLPDSPIRPTVTLHAESDAADAAGRATAAARPSSTHVSDPSDTAAGPEPRSKLFDVSLTQLLGGSMAAATAAALGSRLGVVGTIAGAAVLSLVSAIAGSLYTNSMSRARDVVLLVRSRRDVAAGRPALALPAQIRRGWSRPDRETRRRTLAMAGAVFALAAAFLAGLQLATGAPVTGTDLGGRTAAGAVVDGSADPATGTTADAKAGDGAGAATGTATGGATGSGSDAASVARSSATGTPTTVAGGTPSVASTPAPAGQTPATTSPGTPAAGATASSPGATGSTGATPPAATPAP